MDRDALNVQALSQFGLLTRQQLLSHGVSARFVEWRLSSKRWVAVFPGVYLTSPGRNDWSVRSMAAVLHVDEDAVLSHASAAFSYGLRRSPPDRVEILIPHERRVREPEGIRIQRCRGLARRIDDRAMPGLTTVEHTVLDLAADGTADEAVALAAHACQKGLTWDERLLDVLESRRRHRWMSLLREALGDIGDGAQSTLEVRYVRDVERPHGLPKGRLQQPTGNGRRHHDVGYDKEKVLIELDGLAFHSTPTARITDGRRERATVIDGWATFRAFWPDVVDTPCGLAWDVGALLSSRGWRGSPTRCRRRGCGDGQVRGKAAQLEEE